MGSTPTARTMKRLELDMIVRYDGILAKVVAIGEGRTIQLAYIGVDPCPTCGRGAGIELLEHAPLLRDKLKPVDTC